PGRGSRAGQLLPRRRPEHARQIIVEGGVAHAAAEALRLEVPERTRDVRDESVVELEPIVGGGERGILVISWHGDLSCMPKSTGAGTRRRGAMSAAETHAGLAPGQKLPLNGTDLSSCLGRKGT